MKTRDEYANELLFKEYRVDFWEKFHIIPKMKDFIEIPKQEVVL